MKWLTKLSFLVLTASLGINTLAQTPKSFTHEKEKFLEEMTSFLSLSDKQGAKKFMEEFEPIWLGTQISENQRNKIYDFSDEMLKKRKKADDFNRYLFTVMSFNKSGQSEESFSSWQESLSKVIEGSRKNFSNYLEVCEILFKDNSLFESRAVRWKASTRNYTFDFDSVPLIRFKGELDLICYAKDDSSKIYGTTGAYYPTLERWQGKGGVIDWQRAGMERSNVRAEIDDYSLDVSRSEYSIENVAFYNSEYFDAPQRGILTEKVLANVKPDDASYPRFDSEQKDLVIKDLFKNVDYRGGFSQHGSKFLGSGSKEKDAELVFKREVLETKEIKDFLFARAKTFIIRKDRITSPKASITMYWEEDSIFHPGLEVKFNVETQELALLRGQEGLSRTPYFDSFHKLDMYVESMYWKMDEQKMDLKMITGGGENKALFESANFYDEFRYARLQMMDDVHPLVKIKRYAEQRDTNLLNVSDLAGYFRIDETNVRQMLMGLSTMGFLAFKLDEDQVVIQDRLFDYINARGGKTDYDVLQFNSIIKQYDNATLSLLNFDLLIRGVAEIFLSDSQNVYIYPKEQEVTVKKNRDFDFDGKVVAGRFDIFGNEFDFVYDEFKLNLDQVDSLRMKVPTGELDAQEREILARVKTVLQDLHGEVLIDHPNNKSGLQDFPQYPIFNSLKDSYVYYNSRSIQQGVYDKERFYFHLKPFTVDSLDNFTAEGLAFEGDFESAGIFPNFDETLRLQEDFSLGFKRETPPGGYPIYGGKGTYNENIQLSHEGLRGKGSLDYMSSTTMSDDFIFMPDSMNTIAKEFAIAKSAGDPQTPQLNGKEVKIHWEPYLDNYMVDQGEEPFTMYDGQATLYGGINLKSTGLEGYGTMAFTGSELKSDLFAFNKEDFKADTADFTLEGQKEASLAFSTKNVSAKIDFATRTGEFKANDGGSYVEFPENQYICYLDQFKWFLDQKEVEFTSSTPASQTSELVGSRFISVNPVQDSLSFVAPNAKFDLTKYVLEAKDVKHIEVADAYIYPDSGKVVVKEAAKMETLENAGVLANRTTKFHNIYNASLNIHGKNKYTGTGYYDYVDVAENKKPIHLTSISVDSTSQTLAIGTVTEEEDFTLSPNFNYKGSVTLYASKKNLTYSGSTKILHNCDGMPASWLSFKAEIDPKEIYIPIEKAPKDATGRALATGIVLGKDTSGIYPTFLSPKINTSDLDVVAADGYLHYNNEAKEYRISNKEKLQGNVVPGNFISLNDQCITEGQGKLELAVNLGQVELTTLGNIRHNINNDSTTLDVFIGINYFFNDESMRVMAERLANFFPPMDPIYYGEKFELALMELLGQKEAKEKLQELNLYGQFKKYPKELEKTLFLTDVKLYWNEPTNSYRYKGFIGVSSINGIQINRMVYGMIEFEKKRGRDKFYLYLEPGADTWFYFEYSNNLMSASSSDENFNNAIRDTKADKRQNKVINGYPYQYTQSSAIKKRNFLRRFGVDD